MTERHVVPEAIVVGASAGGMHIIKDLIANWDADLPPLVVVQHLAELHEQEWIDHLNALSGAPVKEADEKESINKGHIYLAPGNYHLLIEKDRTFSLTTDDKVNFARPSINVTFETAAEAYGSALAAIILSGGNDDGADGARVIRDHGGFVIVQEPATAFAPAMPLAAIAVADPQLVLPPAQIISTLKRICTLH